jgi:hypothetical protein
MMKQTVRRMILGLGAAALMTGCGVVGDTGALRDATDLAVDCRPDEALALLARAQEGGGFSSYMADLEKVGILRDAGREAEAQAAFEAYKARLEVDAANAAEAEQGVQEFVEKLREERRERSGSATCP